MRQSVILAAAAIGLAAAVGATWWWLAAPHQDTRHAGAPSETGPVQYYQDPSGAAEYSATPKKDAQGRDFVAVRAPVDAPQTGAPAAQQAGKRILYYRNPMGLADTSPVPKKDSMGMDYIPVYADEANDAPGTLRLSLDKVQRLGVRTEIAKRQVLNESVVLSGTLTADERRQSIISLKFRANIVKLHVAATGERVRAGQPLFEINSPFLLQQETTLAIAMKAEQTSQELGGVYARTNERSARTARQRLELYEVPPHEIARLIRTREPSGRIVWRATQGGTVMEKPVIEGMQVEEGTTLYRIADLSNMWVIAEAPEQALAIARPGATARITLNAFPGRTFEGKVTFIYPEVAMATRTVKVRIELPNADGLLIPGMFASVDVASPSANAVLTVPDSAVIDSGTRQIVLVARGEGLFEPRAVHTGRRSRGRVEIADGLGDGENVVTSATFLIDAESNLRTALQAFTADEGEKP